MTNTNLYTPNVEMIRSSATRVIKGKLPQQVRKELMQGVKNGHLGRLRKEGLKPEIFYHPDHKHGAIQRQNKEAEYALRCITGVVANGAERAEFDFENL